MTDVLEPGPVATHAPVPRSGWPLRVVIPAALLLVTVAVGGWAYLASIRFSGEAETQAAVVRLTRDATILQRTLEYLFTKDALEEVQQELAERGAEPAIEAAVVIDEQTRVIAAANRAMLGKTLDAQLDQLGLRHRGLDLARVLREAQARHRGRVAIVGDGNLIVAVYPVVLGASPGQLRADRLGALIIARDLGSVKAQGRREMARLTSQIVMPVAVFAVLLLVGSYFFVTRRVAALVRAANRFAAGHRNARAGLAGTDELAQVGRAFDDMADQVAAGQRVLADRVVRLAKLSEFSMMLTGDPAPVFEHVVRMIGELFDVRVVCLSEINGRELLFKAVYANGRVIRDAGGCPIDVTPCSTVEDTKDLRVYDGVMERFPQAAFLREHSAFSYCGFPAVDSDGRVVAVTCLLDDKPREFSEEDRHILRVIGQRIGAEVERHRIMAQHRRAEEAVREGQARLEEAQRIAHVGSWEWVAETDTPTWSNELCAILEVDPTKPVPSVAEQHKMYTPHSMDAMLSAIERTMRTGSPYEIELERVRSDDTSKWLLARGEQWVDANGRLIGLRGTALDITASKRADEQIRKSLTEKEVLLKEVHHRVKNNMQVISSLLYLQAQKISDPGLLEVFRESQNRVAAMTLVHEQLYQSANVAEAEFADYARALVQSLVQSYGADSSRIAVQMEMPGVKLDIGTAIPCGLILNELISNALKHAFPDGRPGRIEARLHRDVGGRYQLDVRDDGVGMPPDAAGRRLESLGLRLIDRLVEQLDGTIERTGPPGVGYRITFPAGPTKG